MSLPLKTFASATLIGLFIVGAASAGYHHLVRAGARQASTAAWLEVAQIHAGRSQAAAATLAAVGSAAGLDQVVTVRAREALARAATLTPRQDLLDDPRAIERYKQYQGELTGTLFQLVVGAQRIPALAASGAVLGLRNELLRDEAALASARERYRQAAASYNSLSGAFPGASVMAALAYPDLPAGL